MTDLILQDEPFASILTRLKTAKDAVSVELPCTLVYRWDEMRGAYVVSGYYIDKRSLQAKLRAVTGDANIILAENNNIIL